MPTEVRTFNLDCNCEIVTENLALIPAAKSTLLAIRDPKFPDRSLFRDEIVSYVRIDGSSEQPKVTLVARPHFEGEVSKVHQLEFDLKNSEKFYHSRRPAETWETRNENYRDTLDFHVSGRGKEAGFGRNKTFDKSFTVAVKAPHWITIGIKGTDKRIELQHPEGFEHVHPESRTIEDSPTIPEFQAFLKANNFRTEDKIQFYYWESAARRASSKHDNGWIVIDLERNKIATWAQNSNITAVGEISLGATLVQLPLP